MPSDEEDHKLVNDTAKAIQGWAAGNTPQGIFVVSLDMQLTDDLRRGAREIITTQLRELGIPDPKVLVIPKGTVIFI